MTLPANVRYNEDSVLVEKIRNALQKTGGYCPCKISRTAENICICGEFRKQIEDPEFEGYCYCRLFYKEK